MTEWADVRVLIGLCVALAGLAGFYTGKFTAYIEGQESVLRYFREQQGRAESAVARELERQQGERQHVTAGE